MSILKTITPVSHDLGGFTVRRAVPSPQCRMVGPFAFIDQFGPARLDNGSGVDIRPHPHIGLSTVTWLLSGDPASALEHRDSLGTFCTVRPGTVNLMTAGSGIVHSERTPADERAKGPAMYGMQTWLALPDGQEEIAPAFEAVSDLPIISDNGSQATVIMGSLWGERAATTTHAETIYAEIALSPGGMIPIDAEAEERAVMLVGGEAALDGSALPLYELVVLKPGAAMMLGSTAGGRVMLMGGEAFPTRRHVWWNFVSSSRDRIEQAKEDWRERRFAIVPGDEEEFTPLPDRPNTLS